MDILAESLLRFTVSALFMQYKLVSLFFVIRALLGDNATVETEQRVSCLVA